MAAFRNHWSGILFAVVTLCFAKVNAQWIQAGEYRGTVCNTFCVNGINVLAGTDDGILQSTNNGLTWDRTLSGLGGVNAIAVISDKNETHIFASVCCTGDVGIHSSINGGLNWSLADSGLTGIMVESLISVHDGVSKDYLLAGTYEYGIFISKDYGIHWVQVFPGFSESHSNSIFCFLSVPNGRGGVNIFAGTGAGVIRSTDAGTTWAYAGSGLRSQSINCLMSKGSNIYAGTYGSGILISTDNGDTWNISSTGLTNNIVWGLATDGLKIFAGTYGGGVFVSTDNGRTWETTNTGLVNPYLYSLTVNGSSVFAGTGGSGVFVSTNSGATWAAVNTGSPSKDVLSVLATDSVIIAGANMTGTSVGGVFRSSDQGANWIGTGLPNLVVNCLAMSIDESTLFAGTEAGFFRSTDSGLTWAQGGFADTTVASLSVDGSSVYLGAGARVYVSSDKGVKWNEVYSTGDIPVTALAARDKNIFVGTEGTGVYSTRDGGLHWVRTGDFEYVNSLAVTTGMNQGINLYAGTRGKVYLSTDTGSSWASVLSFGSFGPLIYAFASLPGAENGRNIFAATGRGVYLTTDYGSTWDEVTAGLPPASMSLSANSAYLFVGTQGYAVWRRQLSEMITGINQTQGVGPTKILLDQNYPNPFNPTTIINYELPKDGHVTLKIYDVLGREVKALVDQNQTVGRYSVTLDGSRLASGVYLYQLRAGSYVSTKKMLMIK